MAALAGVLPAVNATLNGLCAILLVAGRVAIARGRKRTHGRLMKSAFCVSVVFLASYVTRFALTGAHRYPAGAPLRALYLAILGSHTVLAVLTPPLAVITLALALRGRYDVHRRWARFTWPVWMYVSATGVVVYFMLYHLARKA
jgi:putative membrane protein